MSDIQEVIIILKDFKEEIATSLEHQFETVDYKIDTLSLKNNNIEKDVKQLQNDNNNLSLLILKVDSINKNIEGMNETIKKHNDEIYKSLSEQKINRLEQKNFISQRSHTCPKNEKINILEGKVKEFKNLKNYVIKTVAIFTSIATTIFGIVMALLKYFNN